MKPKILCIDWFVENEAGVKEHQKDWASILHGISVADIYDERLHSISYSDILLVLIHDSVKSKSPSNYKALEEKLRSSNPAPYVMSISAQPTSPQQHIRENGKWNTTGVSFPKCLKHLRVGFEKLVGRLAAITRSSDATDEIQSRVRAWEEWENCSRPALSALSLLCQGYLAAHGGEGLNGWTADLGHRVTGDARDVIKKTWWIEDIFESVAAMQQTICSELGVQRIQELPDGVRDLVDWINDNKDNPLEKAVVQQAYEALSSIEGQK
jgi:hypothetical protein